MVDSEQEGTIEIKEGITAAATLFKSLRDVGADGFQVTDAGVLITNGRLRADFREGVEGITKVPAEVADLSGSELLDVAGHAVSEARRVLAS